MLYCGGAFLFLGMHSNGDNEPTFPQGMQEHSPVVLRLVFSTVHMFSLMCNRPCIYCACFVPTPRSEERRAVALFSLSRRVFHLPSLGLWTTWNGEISKFSGPVGEGCSLDNTLARGLSDAQMVDPLPASILTRCCREFMTGKNISPSLLYQTPRTRIQLGVETRSWFLIFHHGEQQHAVAHFRLVPLPFSISGLLVAWGTQRKAAGRIDATVAKFTRQRRHSAGTQLCRESQGNAL